MAVATHIRKHPGVLLEAAVFCACTYEAIAIAARDRQRFPPISHLCYRRPALTPLIVGGLTAHLLLPTLRIRSAGLRRR